MAQTLQAMFYHGTQIRADHTPSVAVANGEVVDMGGGLIGICTSPEGIAANTLGALAITGMWRFIKDGTAGPTFTKGQIIAWDDTNNLAVNATSADVTYLLGQCIQAAGTNDDGVYGMLIPGANFSNLADIDPLVDNSGGVAADGTIGVITVNALTATSPGAGADGTTPSGAQWTAAVADLAMLRTAVIACKDAIKELAAKVNAMITG
jgi:hypothetical protein